MDWNSIENKRLIEAVLALKTPDETRRFLRDLMTEVEIEEFSKRLQVAKLLTQKVQYSVIKEKTGLSSRTIARVSRWLNGKEGGYRLMLRRIKN